MSHRLLHSFHIAGWPFAVFHGHDHIYARQELDGIIYQEVPQPGNFSSRNIASAADYGYEQGVIAEGCGHLQVMVAPDTVEVVFVRASLPGAEDPHVENQMTGDSYRVERP